MPERSEQLTGRWMDQYSCDEKAQEAGQVAAGRSSRAARLASLAELAASTAAVRQELQLIEIQNKSNAYKDVRYYWAPCTGLSVEVLLQLDAQELQRLGSTMCYLRKHNLPQMIAILQHCKNGADVVKMERSIVSFMRGTAQQCRTADPASTVWHKALQAMRQLHQLTRLCRPEQYLALCKSLLLAETPKQLREQLLPAALEQLKAVQTATLEAAADAAVAGNSSGAAGRAAAPVEGDAVQFLQAGLQQPGFLEALAVLEQYNHLPVSSAEHATGTPREVHRHSRIVYTSQVAVPATVAHVLLQEAVRSPSSVLETLLETRQPLHMVLKPIRQILLAACCLIVGCVHTTLAYMLIIAKRSGILGADQDDASNFTKLLTLVRRCIRLLLAVAYCLSVVITYQLQLSHVPSVLGSASLHTANSKARNGRVEYI